MNLRVILFVFLVQFYPSISVAVECVILLHGLARTSNSLNEMAFQLTEEGFYVVNIDYPSRKKQISQLSELAVGEGLSRCRKKNRSPVNFVTHSLGGILVRQFYKNHSPENIKRVVMLGPPNHGSEVVDKIKDIPGFELLNGPAGMQLGTKKEDIPKSLGPVNFELGVIAGTQSINLILSLFLPNPDDGKVSVASTKIEGMCSFVALPVSHPFLMKNDQVISQVIYFLLYGKFESAHAKNYCHVENAKP